MNATQASAVEYRAPFLRNLMIMLKISAILSTGFSACGGEEGDPSNGSNGGGDCTTDADCLAGEEWCEEGSCEPCNDSGLVCDLVCEEGFETASRNGCHPCVCVPVNECVNDEGCVDGVCIAGDQCLSWCPAGDPTCCYGNACRVEGACSTDADCTEGEEWCEEGLCETCDNSGLACRIHCDEGYGLLERNGCYPCECVPLNECTSDEHCGEGECVAGELCLSWCSVDDPTCCFGNTCRAEVGIACSTDADCTEGEQWCEDGLCDECDNSGLVCDLGCEEGFELVVRNGCYPCECVPVNECMSDDDCNGSECVPGEMCLSWCPVDDPSCCYGNTCHGVVEGACSADADCSQGQKWCENGLCEVCDNSGLACHLLCAEGEELLIRNGCYPCECVPVSECQGDEDCNGSECVPGEMCLSWCPVDDPSCCYGNTCT